MSADWKKLEDVLFVLAKEELCLFASKHSAECFYGFAFDCNAPYGQVLMSLDTEVSLRKRAEETKRRDENLELSLPVSPSLAKHGIKPSRLYADKSVEELMETGRLDIGGWCFMGINSGSTSPLSKRWRTEWEPLAETTTEQFDEADDPDEFIEQFMEAVVRVLLKMEQARCFDALNRTTPFQTLVVDHDESIEAGVARLDRIRGCS